jgi:hypothetical protein
MRPPIVIVDHKEPEKKEDQSTTAVLPKAEPGRDVFAGEADKDGKSSSYVPAKRPENKEEKQISSVGVKPTRKDGKDGNDMAAFESKPVISEKASETATGVKDKPRARAGAPDEAAVEAEKAAKELFPETS